MHHFPYNLLFAENDPFGQILWASVLVYALIRLSILLIVSETENVTQKSPVFYFCIPAQTSKLKYMQNNKPGDAFPHISRFNFTLCTYT